MSIGNYSDAEVAQWMQGKSDAEVASQAASMGLNQSQIQQAYQLSGKNYTANDINGYASANGYSWGSNGGLVNSAAPVPAPAPAPTPAPANPYAGIDAYMAKQLTTNPGLTAANYSPDVYGSMYQEAGKQFGVNGTFGSSGAAYYSNTLNRTITPEEIKAFAATNPSDKQIFEQAARLGWDAGTVVSAMKSAGMDMSDPKYTDGRAYRMEDSLWRGADGYSVGNGIGGHQAGNGAIVAGGGNYSVDDGNGSSHWASNGPTQSNGYGGTGGGYTANGQVGVNAPDAYNPTKAYVPANAAGVATTPFSGPQTGSSSSGSPSYSSSQPSQTNGSSSYGSSQPGNWQVTTPQTVAGQFNNLTDGSNPLMQKARTQALEQMNARGLVNSSMALTAGDEAAYNAALNIAKQDAGTYADAGKTNANAQTSWGISANNNQTSRDIAAANNANSSAINAASLSAQRELQQATQLYTNLANQTATAGSIQSWGLNSITTIMASDLDSKAKDAAVAQIQTYLTSSYQIQGDWHTSAAKAIDAIFG